MSSSLAAAKSFFVTSRTQVVRFVGDGGLINSWAVEVGMEARFMSENIAKLRIRGHKLYTDYLELQKGWGSPWGDLLKTIKGGDQKLAAVRNMADQMRVAVEVLERIEGERKRIEEVLQRTSKPLKPPTGSEKQDLLRQFDLIAKNIDRVRIELANHEPVCNEACTEVEQMLRRLIDL